MARNVLHKTGGEHLTFQPERQIAQVPEERHGKQVITINIGNGILPAGKAFPVPQFPEKAAYKGCKSRLKNELPVANFNPIDQSFAAGSNLQGGIFPPFSFLIPKTNSAGMSEEWGCPDKTRLDTHEYYE